MTDNELLGCDGICKLNGNMPAIVGSADIRRFAECVLKHFPQDRGTEKTEYSFECIIDGDVMAGSCSTNRDEALKEVSFYAFKYAGYGDITIKETTNNMDVNIFFIDEDML